MRSYNPDDADDRKQAKRSNVTTWMLDAIGLNPDYVYWGPYEDSMCNKDSGWSSRVVVETWERNAFALDELNEVVNFYFYAERDSRRCEACDESGHNPKTKRISDDFYDFGNTGRRWCEDITLDEVQALLDGGRLSSLHPSRESWQKSNQVVATQEMVKRVNAAQRERGGFDLGHDGINRWILIETRAKRLGVWGPCRECDGNGSIFTTEDARLGLVLWVLHPRKGCSRGVDIKSVRQEQLPEVFKYLRQAAARNATRFGKVP